MTRKHEGKHLGIARRQSPATYVAANGQIVRHETHVRTQGMRREGRELGKIAERLNRVPPDRRDAKWEERKAALLKREEQFLQRGIVQVPIYRGMDIRAVRTGRAMAKKLKENPMYLDARNVKYIGIKSGICRVRRGMEEMHLGR